MQRSRSLQQWKTGLVQRCRSKNVCRRNLWCQTTKNRKQLTDRCKQLFQLKFHEHFLKINKRQLSRRWTVHGQFHRWLSKSPATTVVHFDTPDPATLLARCWPSYAWVRTLVQLEARLKPTVVNQNIQYAAKQAVVLLLQCVCEGWTLVWFQNNIKSVLRTDILTKEYQMSMSHLPILNHLYNVTRVTGLTKYQWWKYDHFMSLLVLLFSKPTESISQYPCVIFF